MKLKVNKSLLKLVTVEEFMKPLKAVYGMVKANRMTYVTLILWFLFFATVLFNMSTRLEDAPVWIEPVVNNITMEVARWLFVAAMVSLPAFVIMNVMARENLKSAQRSVAKLENLVELFGEDVLIIDRTKVREYISIHLRQVAFDTVMFKKGSDAAKASQRKFSEMYDAAKSYGWADSYESYWR